MARKRDSMKKSLKILLSCMAAFFVSLCILNTTLTAGGTVHTEAVSFVTDDGVNMTGTLYVPKSASVDHPAAGIVTAPGGNTPHTFYSSYQIELARRGYVVFAYDYYGTMGSGVAMTGSSGAEAAMKYLAGLSFVDRNRLGAIGHSNGGAQAAAAILSAPAQNAKQRSVMFVGCGISVKDVSVLDNINVGVVWGQADEAGQGSFWDTYHKDNPNYGMFAEMNGLDSKDVEPGKVYLNANGAERVVFTPDTFHCMSNIIPSSVSNIVGFFDETLNGNVSGLAKGSHIYLWEEFAVLVMALSLCVMIFPAGDILLEVPFFRSLKRDVPAPSSKGDVKFWVFLIVPAVISALLVKNSIFQGQTILGTLPHLFNVQSTNGFIWWFFLSAVVAVAFFAIRTRLDPGIDPARNKERRRTSLVDLCKAALFGIAVVFVPYLISGIGEQMAGWYGRVFQTYFATIASLRLYEFPVYFVLFAALFSVYAYVQADGLRLAGASDRKNYWITFVANALPAILFVGYIFGTLLITRVTPIRGREISRANGAMMGMLLLYFVIAKNVTYFYKKTGNIYVCAMLNAAFITWLSVNTPQLIV